MTKIVFFTEGDKYKGFVASGHADYADEGEDIICAAISVLITNTINAIAEINHEEIQFSCDEESAYIAFNLLTNKEESTQVLLKALVMGLEGIQNEYGKKFCKVDYKEEKTNVKA